MQDRSLEGIWPQTTGKTFPVAWIWCRGCQEDVQEVNVSWVYDSLKKIRDNLKSCSNVDIRRLTLKQLYLARNKSWCLLQEENLRERVRKPDDSLFDDRDFMELIRLIKGSIT